MASVKSNLIHRVLEVLSVGEEYYWNDESIMIELNKKRRWFEIIRRKIYTVHEANYAINTLHNDLGNDAIIRITGKNADWMIAGNSGIKRVRGCLASREYKQELQWWVWPTRVLSALVGIATIIGVYDNRRAPELQNKIDIQRAQIKSVTEQATKDSLDLVLVRESLETLKLQKLDSSIYQK